MAKFHGVIGYVVNEETVPGVWEEVVKERPYSGDILKNTNRWQQTSNLNDDISISNLISIVADPFAYENFFNMKFIRWMGASWKITNVEVQRPRLILTVGGVYNEP